MFVFVPLTEMGHAAKSAAKAKAKENISKKSLLPPIDTPEDRKVKVASVLILLGRNNIDACVRGKSGTNLDNFEHLIMLNEKGVSVLNEPHSWISSCAFLRVASYEARVCTMERLKSISCPGKPDGPPNFGVKRQRKPLFDVTVAVRSPLAPPSPMRCNGMVSLQMQAMYLTVRKTKKLPAVVEQIGRRTFAKGGLSPQRQVPKLTPSERTLM